MITRKTTVSRVVTEIEETPLYNPVEFAEAVRDVTGCHPRTADFIAYVFQHPRANANFDAVWVSSGYQRLAEFVKAAQSILEQQPFGGTGS